MLQLSQPTFFATLKENRATPRVAEAIEVIEIREQRGAGVAQGPEGQLEDAERITQYDTRSLPTKG